MRPIPNLERDGGSFRDPESWIYQAEEEIIRRIPAALAELLSRSAIREFLAAEVGSGRLVAGRPLLPEQATALGLPEADRYLSHPRLSFVSYPHEWSGTMLADAARLTLDLQAGLLSNGLELKDATAFNVLFRHGAPVFVDWGSFRVPFRPDVWYALGQFQRMFLHPLLLRAHRGWTPAQSFLPNLDGIPLATVVRELGPGRLWASPSLWLDIALPWWFESRNRKRAVENGQKPAVVRPPAAVGTSFQIGNLRRIRRLVDRLESRFVHDGEWEAYAVDCHYDPAADGAKREAVRELLRLAQPASVLDLGCNSGNYSYLAAETGARVVAADGDEGAIARLYARLKAKPADINPVVINLGNPSPALGWGNVERSDFLGRGRSECVLALALIHHLRVAGNWPISHIVKFLSRLAVGHLLAEFVPREDPMFRSITRLRDEDYADWTVGAWHAELNREFELVREVALPASARTLSLWRRR